MRYLYYIAGIVIAISGLCAYMLNTRVEISKPALVVNDRIIGQTEMDARVTRKPYYMTRNQYIDSIIIEQLLIQEAIHQKIHKEESFRRSVEQYYEQSLIKILLDRKLDSIKVDVTDEEINKYRTLSQSRVMISKFGYKSLEDAAAGTHDSPQKIDSDFIDISDDLKFILLNLEPGQMSVPLESGMGVLVYRLDKVIPISSANPGIGNTRIADFLRNKKQELLMEAWTRKLKDNAKIWREK